MRILIIFSLLLFLSFNVASALASGARAPAYAISDPATFWTIITALSAFANRIAEGVKRGLKIRIPTLTEDWIAFISIVASFLAALVGAFFLTLSVFDILPPNPYTSKLPEVVGIILAAGVATFGSEGLHWFLDLLAAGTRRIEPQTTGGAYTQKTETTFTAPKPDDAISSTVATPAGTASSTPTPTPVPSVVTPVVPPDPHG